MFFSGAFARQKKNNKNTNTRDKKEKLTSILSWISIPTATVTAAAATCCAAQHAPSRCERRESSCIISYHRYHIVLRREALGQRRRIRRILIINQFSISIEQVIASISPLITWFYSKWTKYHKEETSFRPGHFHLRKYLFYNEKSNTRTYGGPSLSSYLFQGHLLLFLPLPGLPAVDAICLSLVALLPLHGSGGR